MVALFLLMSFSRLLTMVLVIRGVAALLQGSETSAGFTG